MFRENKNLITFVLFFLIILVVVSCERDVSVSPPDEPPPSGRVIIDSYPKGFKIYLNGKDRIRFTPDSITWLDSGSYNIRLSKNLFNDSSVTVDLGEDGRRDLFIDFSKNPSMLGKINVNSTPEGAEIFINDSNTTRLTPFTFENLLPGIYKVTLKLDNHQEEVFNKVVSSSSSVDVNTTLINTDIWEKYIPTNLGLDTDELTTIITDPLGEVWIGSREGILINDGNGWDIINTINQPNLPNPVINDIHVLNNSRKWIATNDGIAVAQGRSILFNYNSGSNSAPTGLPTDVFTDIFVSYFESPPRYFFGTDLGYGFLGFDFRDAESETREWLFKIVNEIYSGPVTSILVTPSNTIFVGTKNDGLLVLKREVGDGELGGDEIVIDRVFNQSNSSFLTNTVSTIVSDGNGGVYAGFVPEAFDRKGSMLHYRQDDTFEEFSFLYQDSHVRSIFIDRSRRKWLGTSFSVLTYTDNFDDSIILTEENTGLKIENVVGITNDSEGNIWIATQYNGIFKLKDLNAYR